jgi:hypothetical protein
MKCFITGQDTDARGTVAGGLPVPMTLEASAFYNVAMARDSEAKELIAEEVLLNEKIAKNRTLAGTYNSLTEDQRIDGYLEAQALGLDKGRLLYEGSLVAVRILREVRDRYRETGKFEI